MIFDRYAFFTKRLAVLGAVFFVGYFLFFSCVPAETPVDETLFAVSEQNADEFLNKMRDFARKNGYLYNQDTTLIQGRGNTIFQMSGVNVEIIGSNASEQQQFDVAFYGKRFGLSANAKEMLAVKRALESSAAQFFERKPDQADRPISVSGPST